MKKKIENGETIGPYSQGIIASGKEMIFISGQIANDLKSTVTNQTNQVLQKIKKILEKAGSKMEDVVKCNVYMKNFDDFSEMNEEYATFFQIPPARVTIEVSKLPKNALIEIDAIAVKE